MVDQTMDLQRQLKEQITPWVVVPYLIAGCYLSIFDPLNTGSESLSSYGLILLCLTGVSLCAHMRSKSLGVWVLNLGGVASALLAWKWFPNSNAHHALIYPVLCASMVSGAGAGALLALLTTTASWSIAITQPSFVGSPGSLLASTAILWSSVFMLAVGQRPQATLLEWTWEWYARAQENLEAARDRQVELKLALEDLDLTHREVLRLNELLSAARGAIESARRAKEEFVAHVSHELRTPLNMIIGFSDEILERPEVYSEELPQQLLSDVATIKRNSEHLAALVDDVLELAGTDMSYMHLNREWTSLKDIVGDAREGVEAFFVKKGLQLTTAVPADLPPIFCDRLRVRQVLLNLLSNAARFTEAGGVHIDVLHKDNEIVVVVTDTGPGIASSQLQRVFEPFQQANPAVRRRYGGTGLGLAISKRLVEMHGGSISISSQLGKGTTVIFSLPLNRENTGNPIRRAFHPYLDYSARQRSSLAPQMQLNPRILVVEEGHILSKLIENYQETLEVIRVANCEQVEHVLKCKPAVAVVINRRADEEEREASIALSSAFNLPVLSCKLPEERMDLDRLRVADYLIKPVLGADLLSCIHRVAPGARRILLVDDDEDACDLFSRILQHSDDPPEVFEARDGDEALTLMHRVMPDLLLLDLVMPGRDGFAVLAHKATDPAVQDIPVIILSARDPEREPLVSETLCLTRQGGLTPQDLVHAIEALVCSLPPRFGLLTETSQLHKKENSAAPARPETLAPSSVSE